ncbi:MAG: DUF3263 domain-containing protein [Ilumatobacteraceae bacterium]|nr:MAG: DUF3263 domain-containing protein [Actinomycetota bacterium]
MALTEREMALLDFERTWWNHDGPKESMVRERFGCSGEEYYAELNRLLDQPDSIEYDPLGVRRLRRARDRRRRLRLDGSADPASGGLHA